MPLQRKFLGWDQPALPAAAGYLWEQYAADGRWDLAPVIVVLPGSRAGRRLLEILVDLADGRQVPLTPPQITTVGRLPELLYPPQRPFANRLTQQLAWVTALRAQPAERLAKVMAQPPQVDDVAGWLELARLLEGQHRELASDVLGFADVARQGAKLEGFAEQERWEALAEVQATYLRTLDRLELWDRQTARRVAIDQQECHTDRDIVLVGTVDMNETLRRMLDQVARRVTALVVAPPEHHALFDVHGCLVPAAWERIELPVADEQIQVVDGPADQAAAVLQRLAAWRGKYRADQIAIGVPDDRITPHVAQQLEECGIASRAAAGRPLADTPLYRLLDQLADYLETGRYSELAALVRHPDVYSYLETQGLAGDWLTELDRYYNDHLPGRLGQSWLGSPQRCAQCRRVWEAIHQWIKPLVGMRRLDDWSEPLLEVVLAVYGQRELDRDRTADRGMLYACQQLYELLEEYELCPAELMPELTAAQAIRLTLEQLVKARMPLPGERDAIELLGWLELPWEDAPALIVTGCNEGVVPKSVSADPFLPNALRSRLRLDDNARRYARDAYALQVMWHTRSDLLLIAGRRNRDGDPLIPSRLLLAADDQQMATRVQRFFRPGLAAPRPPLGRLQAGVSHSQLTVPLPVMLSREIERIRVTAFRDFLACPYRFYLRHVLRLDSLHDEVEELETPGFGTLLHEVLRCFAAEAASSPDEETLRRALHHHLDHCVAERYGDSWLPSVGIQVEQLRRRLDAFARKQVEWAAQGWRIEHTELFDPDKPATIEVDGRRMILDGRIDRIDVNVHTGERVIFDYKSSDLARSPEKTHQRSGLWVDLQLPLYRHVARCWGLAEPLGLGYIVLPKDTGRADFVMAKWTAEDLAAADEVIYEVIRKVRKQQFWPPAESPPPFTAIYAPICQDGVFERRLAEQPEKAAV